MRSVRQAPQRGQDHRHHSQKQSERNPDRAEPDRPRPGRPIPPEQQEASQDEEDHYEVAEVRWRIDADRVGDEEDQEGGDDGAPAQGEREVLAAYPVAGLETVAELARRAQVSGPTVIRFAAKLGYDRYPDFQQALKDELLARTSTPVVQISSRQIGQDSVLARARQRFHDAVARTFDGLSERDITACAALLADASRPVTAVAGRFSIGLAEYFIGHLQQVRPKAGMVYGGPFGNLSHALDMPRRGVLVAFDFRRY